MKSQFRATSPADAPAVAEFLQRVFDMGPGLPLTEPRHLYWKCWQECCGWPGSRGYMMTKEDEIVAHGTVVPLTYVSGDIRLRMAHLIDWAADPKSIGSGVTLMKRVAQMVDGVMAVGGSDMTQKVLPALGFKDWGEVTNFALPVRPLKRLKGQELSARTGAKFARSLMWWFQAPPVRTKGWTATPIPPEQLASSIVRWPRAGQGIAIVERTAETAAHLLRCPAAPMEFWSVANDGSSIRGYFLLAHVPGQARIVDFYIDSEEQEDWRILVQLAVAQARRNPAVAEVVSTGSDRFTRQALLDCGFRARGTYPLRVLVGKGIQLPAASVRFQMIDSDAAYLHENKIAYWA